jgi:multidrug efflux pump
VNITEICIRKPVLAWMIMGATILFGIVAVQRIGISQFPDVDFPTITIAAEWEGAAPEVMEKDVVEPLEEAVTQVEGIRSITSVSRQGSATVTVELDLSRDVDVALQDVNTRVSQTRRRLPPEVEQPEVSKTNPEDQPIMWVGLSGPYPRQLLADIARFRLKEKLQTVPGVGEINLGGYLDRNIRIWVDAAALDERGLTVAQVVQALRREHVELPAGRLETDAREVNVRVLGEAFDLNELKAIVVDEGSAAGGGARGSGGEAPGNHVNGGITRLSDVALIEDGFEDERRLSRVNGVPAQGLGVRKQRGANAVSVAHGIKAKLAEVQATLPPDMVVGINFDSTQFIEESVHEIQVELLLAVGLTALVCWLFLASFSSTLNVVLAIPMSLLGTIAVIYFAGFTLNTFTLLGLSLAVGIVVDDAIMVLENIYRHAEMGKDRVTASREGTAEITFAALAATIAVIAIFIPVVFMSGVVGRFFLQFGITLCVAVALSYVEAITLAPARCAQILDVSRHSRGRIGSAVDRVFAALETRYRRALGWSSLRPWRVVLSGLAVFGLAIFVFRQLPGEFVPSQDQSRLMVRFQTQIGSSLAETDRVFKRAEDYLNSQPEVLRAFTVIGGFGGAGVNTGIFFVTLKPREERVSQAEFAARIRKELNSFPGVRAVVQDLSQQGFTAQRGFPVEFSVRGPDWDQLIANTQGVMEKLEASGIVTDLDTDYRLGMPEVRIRPDRALASDLGVSMQDVGTTLQTLVGGVIVGKYSAGGRRVDVRMRLLKDQRGNADDLKRLKVRGDGGALVPLATLTRPDEKPALQAITRRDRERAITVFGNIAPGHSQQEAVEYVERLSKDLPPPYSAVLGGASVAYRESMSSLAFALTMGIIVAYMVLASQFNSFLHPITVLTILPLSVAGAAFALWLSGNSLNIFSMIGLLLLMGIVKKNSIILVDYANQARERGADARNAMLEAGPVRLRPILMTSIATMMAAVPAALGLGAGSEVRTPMAIAVIGGVIVSTALSLLVVPCFYVLADRLKTRTSRVLSRAPKAAPAPSPEIR